MTDLITIPRSALALLTMQGYVERYHAYRADGLTSPAAWEAVEDEFKKYFQTTKYKNHESFKSTLKKWRKNHRKN